MYTEKDAYKAWYSMNERCSNGYALVCEDWKYFQNFKRWYLSNIYATKQFKLEVDKDLFSKENKIYSSETCCLLPQSLNTLLASCTSRNEFLPGVTMTESGAFAANVKRNITTKRKTFKTEKEAFFFYKNEKEKNIKIAVNAYEFLLPEKIYKELMNYEVKPIRGISHPAMKKIL